jgi:hypothetical protein
MDGGIVEATEGDTLRIRLAHEEREQLVEGMAAGEFVAPVGDEQQDRQCSNLAGEEAQQFKRGSILPVRVLQ